MAKHFFEEAGGVFIKFGQLLALRVDVLPKEYALTLIDLFDRVQTFSYEEIERTFKHELGVTPEQIFAAFKQESLASASFGQVYPAKLEDGTIVVVKIQRPGINHQVAVDFFIIDILALVGDLFFKIPAMPWKKFAREFKDWTRKELDYRIEAENTQKIYENIARMPANEVHYPQQRRLNREVAFEQLNNWLVHLVETDVKLYHKVNNHLSAVM